MSADKIDQLSTRQQHRVNLDLNSQQASEPMLRSKLPRISIRPSVPFPSADIYQIAQCLDQSDDDGARDGDAANLQSSRHSSFITSSGDQKHQRYLDSISELYSEDERPRPLAEVLPLPIPQHLRDQLCFEEALLVSMRNDNDDATEGVAGSAEARVERLYRCGCGHSHMQ